MARMHTVPSGSTNPFSYLVLAIRSKLFRLSLNVQKYP